MIDLLGRGRIDPRGMITGRVDFDSFCAAFEALKRPSDQIKVMLEPTWAGTQADSGLPGRLGAAQRFAHTDGR